MAISTTANPPCQVLLVEDNLSDAKRVRHALSQVANARYCVEHVTHLSAALEQLNRGGIDVVLVDLSLLCALGLEAFRGMFAVTRSVPFVVLAGLSDEPLAIELLRHGAQDYVLRNDLEPKTLARSIRYAIERRRATELEPLNQQLELTNASLVKAVSDPQETSEELAQFTYFASHDLQEPVRKINHFVEQLQADLGDELNDDVREDMHFILDAARRMQALTRSILALSKTDKAAIEAKPVDLESCVNEALECLAERIEATHALIVRDPLPVVRGDRTLLSHLYQNLIGNALKFATETPVIQLTADRSGEHWMLGVRDNGIGLEPELAQSLFVPFRRLNGQGQYEGRGNRPDHLQEGDRSPRRADLGGIQTRRWR